MRTVALTVLLATSAFLPIDAAAEQFIFECNYSYSSSMPINSYEFKPRLFEVEPLKDFAMKFAVQSDMSEAYLIGDLGTEKVISTFAGAISLLTLTEVTSEGEVNVTSVNLDTLASVHSRHVVIVGELFPSQMYGRCKLLKP